MRMTPVELVGAPQHDLPMRSGSYDPWDDLVGRDHITFIRHPIAAKTGGGLYADAGDESMIVLAPGLLREERRAALAHELVHDERRILGPGAPPLVMVKEEAAVRRIATERLVPAAELLAFCDRRSSIGEPVTPGMVAEEFDVPIGVAREAMRRLATDGGATA